MAHSDKSYHSPRGAEHWTPKGLMMVLNAPPVSLPPALVWTSHRDESWEGSSLHGSERSQKARRTGSGVHERFLPQFFHRIQPLSSSALLFHCYSLLSSSLTTPTSLHAPPMSFPLASLQLLCGVLPLHTEQLLSKDGAVTVWSAWPWTSCLDGDKGNSFPSSSGFTRDLGQNPPVVLDTFSRGWKDWWKVKPVVFHLGDTRQPQKHPLFLSEVSAFQGPDTPTPRPSSKLRGAGHAFGRMCFQLSSWDLGTEHWP